MNTTSGLSPRSFTQKTSVFISILLTVGFFSALPAQDSTKVFFRKSEGVHIITCKVNDFPVEFVFDTGAGTVCLPKKMADLMQQQGKLTAASYTGKISPFKTASGETIQGREVIFRQIKIGDFTLQDVQGVVIAQDSADALFGQTALERFSTYTIDNSTQYITFTSLPDTLAGDSVQINCSAFPVANQKDSSLSTSQYLQLGMKPLDAFWTEPDYNRALAILEQVNTGCPEKLPRKNSVQSGAVFKKLLEQRELIDLLKSQISRTGVKIGLLESVSNHFNRFATIYMDDNKPFMPDEFFELIHTELIRIEELATLVQEIKRDTNILPPTHLELIRNTYAQEVNAIFDYFLIENIPFKTTEMVTLAKQFVAVIPPLLKMVNSRDFRAALQEQAFILSNLHPDPAIKTEFAKLWEQLKPDRETNEAAKERSVLLVKLKKQPHFTLACLAYDGKFLRTDKDDVLEYRLDAWEPKIKLILSVDKLQSTLKGKVTNVESRTYPLPNATNTATFTEKIDLILLELVGN